MGRERKARLLKQQLASAGKDRHKRDARPMPKKVQNITSNQPPPQPLKALKDAQKYKYTSRFEWVQNEAKKDKRINLITSTSIKPPAGYTFIPVGNPLLTKACKETSRAQDAPVYIVTLSKTEKPPNPDKPRNTPASEDEDESILEQLKDYKSQMTRLGYHFREQVVDQVKLHAGIDDISSTFPWVTIQQNGAGDIIPEPIPENQADIYRQADLVISDLFPRIPNTDRALLIAHAFNKSAPTFRGEKKVGLAADIVLSRRCALAVLAHIRHTHTRYDELLKEYNYIQARKAVQTPCLDILVKWRGDEETGRDIATEVLRELVVIDDDSETERSDDEDGDSSDNSDATQDVTPSPHVSPGANETPVGLVSPPSRIRSAVPVSMRQQSRPVQHATASGHVRKPSRNFRRYEKLERKYGAEELTRSRTHQERLLGAAVPVVFPHSRDGSYCSPPPSSHQPAAGMVVIHDATHADRCAASHGYQPATHSQASAFPVAFSHIRTLDMGIQSQPAAIPPHHVQRPHQGHFTRGEQEVTSRGQQPLLVRERVRSPERHFTGAPSTSGGRRPPFSPLHLEDMLVPSIEAISPSAYSKHQARGIFDRPRFQAPRELSPKYQLSTQNQALGQEHRPDGRQDPAQALHDVKHQHPQNCVQLREAPDGARRIDAPSGPLNQPRDRLCYPARPVPATGSAGCGQSALDTMGFIQIRRHDNEPPFFVSRGQRHPPLVYHPSGPTEPRSSTYQTPGLQSSYRDEAALPVSVHRAPARPYDQNSATLAPQSSEVAPLYSSRSSDDRFNMMSHGYNRNGHISSRDGAMIQSLETHHLQRRREVVIID